MEQRSWSMEFSYPSLNVTKKNETPLEFAKEKNYIKSIKEYYCSVSVIFLTQLILN